MNSLSCIACGRTSGADVDLDELIQHCEAGAGHEATSAAISAPSVAFPATFAFQLSRQAGYRPRASFYSL